MVKVLAGVLAALAAPSAAGAMWRVCVEDPGALLSPPTRAAVLREFQSVIGNRVAGVEFNGCESAGPRILLAVETEAPPGLAGVLGLAHRESDRITPRLQVFHGPVVRHLGEPNSAAVVGRALARVAAHEAQHFLNQQSRHCAFGLMRAFIPAYELASRDPRPFRRSARCPDSPEPPEEPQLTGATEPY